MGIDIYAEWRHQTEAEKQAQFTGFDITKGAVGYLREAYHGEPYVTQFLVREAFDRDGGDFVEGLGVQIPAATMRTRLPRAIHLAVEREKIIYGHDIDEHDEIAQSFVQFVELCERKEKQLGETCYIYASC